MMIPACVQLVGHTSECHTLQPCEQLAGQRKKQHVSFRWANSPFSLIARNLPNC